MGLLHLTSKWKLRTKQRQMGQWKAGQETAGSSTGRPCEEGGELSWPGPTVHSGLTQFSPIGFSTYSWTLAAQ